jgi:hypothetical protein
LKRDDSFEIRNTKFSVKGWLELEQNAFRWKELLLVDLQTNEEVWLNVEPDTQEVVLYRNTGSHIHPSSCKEPYRIIENGKGKVISADNIPDVSPGDVVEYVDYIFEDRPEQLLSYEKWDGEKEFFIGERISPESIITSAPPPVPEAPDKTINRNWEALLVGQELRIKGESFYISGLVKHRQTGFYWTEYRLFGGKKEHWLSVEKADKEVKIGLSHNIPFRKISFFDDNKYAEYQGKRFNHVETGNAKVVRSEGDVDFDNNEPFTFIEYESSDGQQLSIEKWTDETEASLGEELREADIEVREGRINRVRKQKGKSGCLIRIILAGIFVFIVYIFLSERNTQPIRRELMKNSQFNHVTAVTSNDKANTKSDIFSSGVSPDSVCKKIIKIDPEHIRHVITSDESEKDQILIQSDKETVVIYISENDSTYIQVSEKKDDPQGYSSYRSANSHRLHRFYNSGIYWMNRRSTGAADLNTTGYDSYLFNARQESVNTRRTQGGGTSFGK